MWFIHRHSRWAVAGALVALLAALLVVVGVVVASRGGPRRPAGGRVPAPGPPAQPAPSTQEFGANVNRLFDNPQLLPLAGAQLGALQATGATLARSDALWEASEPQPPVDGRHRYAWGFDDGVAAALAAHGLRWLPVLDYSVSWAQSIPGQDHSPPAHSADYAAYAGAFAARYGPGGTFWISHPGLPALPVEAIEIWNEPDNPTFWVPHPDPAGYAELYAAARGAILAVQPTIRVLIGGLWHPAAFLSAMLRAQPELVGHIDGVALHPYGANPAQVLARVRGARALLRSLGLASVPLYVTEVGWTTSPPGTLDYLPERLRPAYLAETLDELGHLDCGVAAVLVYTWVTEQSDPADGQQWYGIHPPLGGPSPDTAAFAFGLRSARSPGPAMACSPS